jgi:L-lactate dehydrogenase
MAVKRICEVIVRNEKAILPVSTTMHGEHGIEGIVLSMPCVVGSNGIETQIPIVLSDEEIAKLQASANVLKEILASLELN